MTPIEAFQMYTALRAHFGTGSYDYIKYQGRLNKGVLKSYQTNKVKYQFEKLSRHSDTRGLIISNLLENESVWVNELFTESSQEIYKKWKKRQEALTYEISQELNAMDPDNPDKFDTNFICDGTSHPTLLHLHLRGRVSIETLLVLDALLKFSGYWNKKMKGDPIWEMVYNKMVRYRPFLTYDKEKMKQLLTSKFLSSQPV